MVSVNVILINVAFLYSTRLFHYRQRVRAISIFIFATFQLPVDVQKGWQVNNGGLITSTFNLSVQDTKPGRWSLVKVDSERLLLVQKVDPLFIFPAGSGEGGCQKR